MSDYQAIAGVSRTLRTLLRDRMEAPPSNVTIAPPDVTIDGSSGTRVNLYLYHMRLNAALRNQEIPGDGHPSAYGFPPLSLELYYLFTASGGAEDSEHADLQAQQILGDAMRVLHDFTIVTESLLVQTVGGGTIGDLILDGALRGEFERMKITFEPMTIDDLSKIWTAMSQSNFRRSVGYQVSVVQIESGRTRRPAPPVGVRRVHATASSMPRVGAAFRTPGPGEANVRDTRLRAGEQLTVEGANFGQQPTDRTWVRFGSLAPVLVSPVNDRTIRVAVPDDDGLPAGGTRVAVEREMRGDFIEGALDRGVVGEIASLPADERRRQRSNDAVFLLVPSVQGLTPPQGPTGTLLSITGSRLFDPNGRNYVIIGDRELEPLSVPTPNPEGIVRSPSEVMVRIEDLAVGQHGVRVRVNGAESTEDELFEVTP